MRYSISDLEQLSGVQIHTIRIWERRYNALRPMRTSGNTRFYDDSHLKRLLNIVGLSKTGLKISEVCALSEAQIDQMLEKEISYTFADDKHVEFYISQLLNFGLSYDEVNFDELISRCILQYGLEDAYKQVMYPLLVRLGLMWRRDHICPAQEHFLSSIIRQKLFAAINETPLPKTPASCWLLYLPEDEDHDIGLLFANYILRKSGQKVIFLGAKVPLESVEDAFMGNAVNEILLFMVRTRPTPQADRYIENLSNQFPDTRIHVAGNTKMISEMRLAHNVSWLKNIQDFEEIIKSIRHVN